jgi:guanylate kinase
MQTATPRPDPPQGARPQGPLIILSGPSGSGKSTVIGRVLKESGRPLRLSVSATTRPPRPGEEDGVHYHFWTREHFREGVEAGAFVEWAEVHGNCYGTPRREVDDYRARGFGVILDIDVQGAAQVRRRYPEAVSLFLRTSRWEEYERRLRRRHTEDNAAIARRLATARRELERVGEFDHVVVNDDLDTAVARVCDLIARAFERGQSCSTN